MYNNYYGAVVVGAGGTGSLFLGDFCRFLSSSDKDKRDIVIADGDTVERKNLARQWFSEEDIGRNKAAAMAEVLTDVFDVNIEALGQYIDTPEEVIKILERLKGKAQDKRRFQTINFYPVIISCVDNVACRLLLEEVFRRLENCIYIDSGNGYDTGQCVYAVKENGKVTSPMRDHYNLIYDEEKDGNVRSRTQMSCEELNAVEPQHILTNRMAALCITRAMILLLETGKCMRGIATFDAFQGTSSLLLPEDLGFVSPFHKDEVAEPPKKKRASRKKKAS